MALQFSADRHFTHCMRLKYGHGGDPRFTPALLAVGHLAAQCPQFTTRVAYPEPRFAPEPA
jgi:hypothetical protein